jgi:tRNA(Ile)-lysidine synthetase-like protein
MEQFYGEWMNRNKYWFNKNKENDEYLSNKFGYLINEYDYNRDNNPIIGILIYDQLTRHYYRNEYSNHIITYFNKKALEIALIIKNDDNIINNLTYNEWLFYMLVYRHTNEKEHLMYVINEMWKKRPIPKPFIKATYERAKIEEELIFYDYINYDVIKDKYDKNILDNNPIDEINENIDYELGDFSKIPLNKLIIVSLSGGVDSICCLYYLSKITKNIIAVHINYNNREETKEEVKFLRNICNKLRINLFVRDIIEIKRQKCIENYLREVYENYTKNIRFNSYKKAYKLITRTDELPLVILGHNKDDCFENILTNITYKNKYENLSGMELISTIDNIIFHRPLYNVNKEDIYKFAKNHNLPYLKNSTPSWSQRGKIRTSIIPVLEKWDKRVIDGLFSLTDVLKDLHINFQTNINNFKKTSIENINNINTSVLYWKYGINKIFNFYPSLKSLKSLIERLIILKENYEKKQINKKEKIIINKKLFINIWKSKDNNYGYELINI